MTQNFEDAAIADARVCVLNLQLGTGPTMTPAMAHAGLEALSTALRDPDIGVIVLTGSAEQFCTGAPLPARAVGEHPSNAEKTPAFIDALHDWLLALHDSNKLTIAAVEGQASGAGLALALACDLIVAARHARFALPASGQATGRNAGALWLAAQNLPRGALAELALLDTPMPAERAHTLGVVCKLTEPGLALQQATLLARSAAQCEPATLATLKSQMARAMERPLQDILAEERDLWLRRPAQ